MSQAPQSSGAFVRGGRLVVSDGMALPDRCIKCNAPVAEGRVTRKFAYNPDDTGPGALRHIPFVGHIAWLVWAVGQMRTRQYVTVSFCVCKRHRATRVLTMIGMAIGMLAGVALVAIGASSGANARSWIGVNTTEVIVGVWVFLMGAMCGFFIPTLQVAVALNKGVELKGAGKKFLNSMPKLGKQFGR